MCISRAKDAEKFMDIVPLLDKTSIFGYDIIVFKIRIPAENIASLHFFFTGDSENGKDDKSLW